MDPAHRHACFAAALSLGCLGPWAGPHAAAAQGPAQGQVTCQVTDNGRPASGSLELREDGRAIASGRCGSPLRVPVGQYQASLRLDGALDRPERQQNVSVTPGAVQTVRADFRTGELEVVIEAEGGRSAGMVTVLRQGQRVGTVGAGVMAHLSEGTYSVVVRHRATEKRVDDVRVTAGSRTATTVRF